MEQTKDIEISAYLNSLGLKAQAAKTALQSLDTELKNKALTEAANALVRESGRLLLANEKDYARAKEAGMAEGLLDRL